MINRFAMKNLYLNNNKNFGNLYVNPYRIKRTYHTMIEQSQQSQNMQNAVFFSNKRLKLSEGKPPESIIKNNKPKIPEKILKEIERYNYQRFAYNRKIIPCNCEE